jgi:hypothetical protein
MSELSRNELALRRVSTARTAILGTLTKRLIDERLPPAVLDDLAKKNPTMQ